MKKLFAEYVSFFFHPVLFALLMPFLITYRITGSGFYALKWAIFSSFFIFVGIILIFLERIRGIFSDFDITKKEERFEFFLLLLILAFFYLLAAIFFKGLLFPLSIVSLGILLGIVIFVIVNSFLKASIHVATACAFVISIAILYGDRAFWLSFWVVPLIVWARLILKRHTLSEAVIGGFLGILITLITVFLGKHALSI